MYQRIFRSALIVVVVALFGQSRYCLAQMNVSAHDSSAERLKIFLKSYLNPGDGVPDKTTRVSIVSVPLESGATEEKIVYVTGRGWCGSGGCTLLVLEPSADTFKVLGDLSVIQLPVKVLPGFVNGHPDITVSARGVGVGKAYRVQLSFDGHSYPEDVTLAPAKRITDDKGQAIITAASTGVLLYE